MWSEVVKAVGRVAVLFTSVEASNYKLRKLSRGASDGISQWPDTERVD
jgi:hypothetical protein